MDDIVVRLRKWSISTHAVPASDIMDEAADEIERLRRIVAMWEDCAFKTKDLYGNVFVPRTSTYDGGVKRIVSGEWSEPKVSTGHTGNQWFTIPEPPGSACAGETRMDDDSRLALEQEIADLRFALRQATDRASLAEVKCSQLLAAGRLTDAEREAVEAAYYQAIASEVSGVAQALRGLLERTK